MIPHKMFVPHCKEYRALSSWSTYFITFPFFSGAEICHTAAKVVPGASKKSTKFFN